MGNFFFVDHPPPLKFTSHRFVDKKTKASAGYRIGVGRTEVLYTLLVVKKNAACPACFSLSVYRRLKVLRND